MCPARLGGRIFVLFLLVAPQAAAAQTIEIAPFAGYRFGGDLYEVITGTALDIDGAACVGATIDVFVDPGGSVSFIYSRQEARIEVPEPGRPAPHRLRLAVEHWHFGGTRELDAGPVRPFFSGSLGLTRFGSANDSETRFSLAGGGGIKLMPSRHLGVRLDGRVYAVFVDGDVAGSLCTPGQCLIGLDVSAVWQAEFTAGLVLSF